MHIRALQLRSLGRFLEGCELRIDFRIDLRNDRLEVQKQDDTIFHLDDADHARLIAHLRRRLHILPRNAVDTGNIFHEEADIEIVDFRHDDIPRLLCRRDIQTSRKIHQGNCLAAQSEKPVNIRMRLRHSRDRRTRNDLAHLRHIDSIVDLANAEFHDLELIRAGLKKNSFFISIRFCHQIAPIVIIVLPHH